VPTVALQIAIEVARGLAFLHSRKVVHFDIKSANVLLTK
jgi:serine/threonine protein kinase